MKRDDDPREGIFTRYVRSLGRDGSSGEEEFEAVWDRLRSVLARELVRRGLWSRSPALLGVYGSHRWTDPVREKDLTDALDELVADAYQFIFVDRIVALREQLDVKPNVDGLVFLNVGHFIGELQRRHDPLGARIFSMLRRIAAACLEDGRLVLLAGDSRIGNDSVIGFPSSGIDPRKISAAELRAEVAKWCDELLPDLVTTRGKGQIRLDSRLRARILGLEQHAAALPFRDLVGELRQEVRRRWMGVLDVESGETGVESIEDEVKTVVSLVFPDAGFEERQGFRRLVECVNRELATSGEPDVELLKAIWDLLVGWAGEATDDPELETLRAEKTPSRRQVGRILDIERHRLTSLYEKLGGIVRACRSGEKPSQAPQGPVRGQEEAGMQQSGPSDVKSRLRAATAEALAKVAALDGPIGPGDVVRLSASADWPVVWVLLDIDPQDGDRFIAVPADTNPLAGSTDWQVPRSRGGPLTLRCALVVALPRSAVDPKLRGRCLAAEDLAAAREMADRTAAADVETSPLREEVDLDSAYRDWMADVPEVARAAIVAAFPAARRPIPFPRLVRAPRLRGVLGLAAVLALAVVGLSIQLISVRRQLDRVSQPYFDPPVTELALNEPLRAPKPWILPADTEQLILYLVLAEPYSCPPFRVELRDERQELMWARELDASRRQLKLVLPRRFLDRRPSWVRVVGRCGETETVLEDIPIQVRWE